MVTVITTIFWYTRILTVCDMVMVWNLTISKPIFIHERTIEELSRGGLTVLCTSTIVNRVHCVRQGWKRQGMWLFTHFIAQWCGEYILVIHNERSTKTTASVTWFGVDCLWVEDQNSYCCQWQHVQGLEIAIPKLISSVQVSIWVLERW